VSVRSVNRSLTGVYLAEGANETADEQVPAVDQHEKQDLEG
jgi:hypothetical protein